MEENKNKKQKSPILKLIEDQRAISECIRKGGDLNKLAEERGLKFAKPVRAENLNNRKKTGVEEALEDVKNGRVHEFESVDELFAHLGV
jgi:hypothetical protein